MFWVRGGRVSHPLARAIHLAVPPVPALPQALLLFPIGALAVWLANAVCITVLIAAYVLSQQAWAL